MARRSATVGSIRSDAILIAAAWRVARSGDETGLDEVNGWHSLWRRRAKGGSKHPRKAMPSLIAIEAAWGSEGLAALFRRSGEEVAFPVALAAAAADHSIGLGDLLEAALLAFVSNLVSAALRLGPIGQSDAQRIVAQSLPSIRAAAAYAASATLDDLGSATLRSDIASMRHETQYSRLFRS